MVFKLAKKYRIIQQSHNFKNILIDDFKHHRFIYRTKFLQALFITEPKITNCKDETLTL